MSSKTARKERIARRSDGALERQIKQLEDKIEKLEAMQKEYQYVVSLHGKLIRSLLERIDKHFAVTEVIDSAVEK